MSSPTSYAASSAEGPRGIELNVPTVTQLAVLAPDSERVIPLARALDVLGAYSAADKVEKSEKSEKGEKPARALERLLMPADAFYAPDYDLLVLSPERLDSVGQTFRAQNQSIYREGFNRAELTGGGGPKLGPDPRNPLSPGRQPEDVARMQTLAAVEAYLQEEGELSAVSREGSPGVDDQGDVDVGLLGPGLEGPQEVVLPDLARVGGVEQRER